MTDNPLTSEVSNSKLAAVFDSAAAGRDAAEAVTDALGLHPTQVKLITPDSPDLGIGMEPEGGNIWRTIKLAHVRMGIFGAAAGAIAFALMMWIGVPFVMASPVTAALVTIAFGTVGGLFLGGLVSLRPDHDPYIDATREAVRRGRTAVVVHARNRAEQKQARELLESRGAEVTSTL